MVKIELEHSRIRRIHDLHDFSFLIFPHKTATDLRAAGIAILAEIKNNPDRKIQATDYIAEKYDLRHATVCKARKRLRKIGLIDYRDYHWQLSTRFEKALENLAKRIQELKEPAIAKEQAQKEKYLVTLAKAMKMPT